MYPEVIAATLKNKLHNVYFVYVVAKSLDASGNGCGLINHTDLLSIATQTLGVSESTAYRILQKGTGVFWRASKKGIIGLMSHGKAYRQIGIEMYSSLPVRMRLQHMGYNSGLYNGEWIKDVLLSIVASWDNGQSPLAVDTIAELTGICSRTVQRRLRCVEESKYGIVLLRHACHRTMCDNLNQNEAKARCSEMNAKTGVRHRTEPKDGKFAIVTQISNSYQLDGVERIGKRRRHRQLKHLRTRFNEVNYV